MQAAAASEAVERRFYRRIRRKFSIRCMNESIHFAGISCDICPDGVFVMTNHLLPPRSIVEMEIWIDEDTPAKCRGQVVWVNRGQVVYYPAGFGVQFTEIPEAFRKRLLHLCDERFQEG